MLMSHSASAQELYRKSKETASLSLLELARTSAATSPAKSTSSSPSKASVSCIYRPIFSFFKLL